MIAARLSAAGRLSAMAGPGPERRLIRHDRGARNWLVVSVLAGVAAVVALIAQLGILALAVAGVFIDGRTLEDVLPWLSLAFLLLLARAALGAASDLAARRSAERLVGTLRARS